MQISTCVKILNVHTKSRSCRDTSCLGWDGKCDILTRTLAGLAVVSAFSVSGLVAVILMMLLIALMVDSAPSIASCILDLADVAEISLVVLSCMPVVVSLLRRPWKGVRLNLASVWLLFCSDEKNLTLTLLAPTASLLLRLDFWQASQMASSALNSRPHPSDSATMTWPGTFLTDTTLSSRDETVSL